MKTQTASDFVDDMWDSGKRRFEDLTTEQAARLTGLVMRSASYIDRAEYVTECQNADAMVLDIADYLASQYGQPLSAVKASGEALLQSILSNVTGYGRHAIEALFDARADLASYHDTNKFMSVHGRFPGVAYA